MTNVHWVLTIGQALFSALHIHYFIKCLQQPYVVDDDDDDDDDHYYYYYYYGVFQMKKLRHGVKLLAQGHTAREGVGAGFEFFATLYRHHDW